MAFADHPLAEEFTAFIHELADAAGAQLAERHEGSRFETKADESPVTEFDRGVEQRLRTLIADRYPEHGIIGEEFPPERENAEFVWVMDPIDGTKSFVAGIPVFTTLIALCRNGTPVIGVIDASVTQDRWVGVDGRATTLNGHEVHTSGRQGLTGATLSWSQPDRVLEEHRAGLEEVNERVAWRVFGAASYGFGRVASGAIDLAGYSGGFGPYDVCAIVPIVEGAGGVVSDELGQPITIKQAQACIVSASPELHREALSVLCGG